MKGYMYILLCSNGKYYTGSTKDLEKRWQEHLSGNGANFTKKYPPVKLVYYEEYDRIDNAFYREKQVQGWGRKKKEALINGNFDDLPQLAKKVFLKNSLSSIRLLRNHNKSLSSVQLLRNHSESDEENGALSVSDNGGNVPKRPNEEKKA